MDRQTRERALRLPEGRRSDPRITYADIGRETGHGRRQLMRLSKRLELEGADAVLVHGNTGTRPHNAATPDEAGILRESRRPYPEAAIAHFRDTCIEDVTGNPARADEVERHGPAARSASWFRVEVKIDFTRLDSEPPPSAPTYIRQSRHRGAPESAAAAGEALSCGARSLVL